MPDTTSAIAQIESGADVLRRYYEDASTRYENASEAGAALAAEVYRFTQDPDAVGTDALEDAYQAFMGRHAGNFAAPLEERT